MDPRDAVLTVLRDEAAQLHWTQVQDLALRRGYLDPFAQRDIRRQVLRALADLATDGAIRRTAKGVYEIAS